MSANQEERVYTVQELVDCDVLGDPVNGGRSRLLELLGSEVFYDAIGRPCVSETTAVRLAEERKAEQTALAEQAARQFEEASKTRPVRKGVPAVEGADTGVAALQAQDGYTSPRAEFGRPAPNFLEEELAAGRRAAAAKKEAARKLKEDLQ